jgi:ABC-type amino acid transport substrate-binding protein
MKSPTRRMRNEPEQEAMSVEYLLVSFPEDRDVLADGDRVGVTNHTILITANEYTITLSGDDYVPTSQDVVVAGTSIMRPLVVVFRAAAAAVAAGAVAAALADRPGGLPVAAELPKPASRPRRGKPPTR